MKRLRLGYLGVLSSQTLPFSGARLMKSAFGWGVISTDLRSRSGAAAYRSLIEPSEGRCRTALRWLSSIPAKRDIALDGISAVVNVSTEALMLGWAPVMKCGGVAGFGRFVPAMR